MHNLNEIPGKKARWELQNDAVRCFEQLLPVAPNKIGATQPLTSPLTNHTSKDIPSTAQESKDKLINDVLLWIPTYGSTSIGRPAKTSFYQLCADTEFRPNNLPRVMTDRSKWGERIKKARATDIHLDDDDEKQGSQNQIFQSGKFFSQKLIRYNFFTFISPTIKPFAELSKYQKQNILVPTLRSNCFSFNLTSL